MNTIIGKSNAVDIASAIEEKIRTGEWPAEHLLPPVRGLAETLTVSPNTVATAYKLLRDAGLVITEGRRGTRVLAEPCSAEVSTPIPQGLRDLASGNVDADLLPQPDFAALAKAWQPSGYDVEGEEPLLHNCALHWLNSQNIDASHIAVFSGALDAIERALRAQTRPSTCVIVEEPAWPPLLALLQTLRLKVLATPVDEQGALVPSEEWLNQASAVILTPRAHNPTGVSLSAARAWEWQQALAERADTLLILDDHWGPLSNAPLTLSEAPQWLYVLSTSKMLGPDLRVALACGSPRLLQRMHQQQLLGPRWVSWLLQRTAALLWNRLEQEGGLQHISAQYHQRRTQLIQALQQRGIHLPFQGEGLHIWLPVNQESYALQSLASAGWAVQSGTPFQASRANAIRISLGNVSSTEDINALAEAIKIAVMPNGSALN